MKRIKKTKSSLTEDIWPQGREVLHRPDRYKYVRKLVEPQECVFCLSASRRLGFSNLKLAESDHSMVVLNKYPYNTGHILVLPLRHVGDLTELSEKEYHDQQTLLGRAVRVIKEIYNPSGMNLGMNHGAVAGAGIPDHLHWHIVPRWSGDTNFFPVIAESKVLPETLEQSYERLLKGFKKIK